MAPVVASTEIAFLPINDWAMFEYRGRIDPTLKRYIEPRWSGKNFVKI